MGVKRKQHSAEFKARVAMASLSGEKTLAELSAEFGVHPTMISNWKKGARKARGRAVVRASKAPAAKDAQKVIDDQIPPNQQRPYQDRLRKLVAGESEHWEPIGSFPQTQGGIVFPASLHVYARRPVASLATTAPAIRLDRLRALMVRKELR